MSGFERSDNQNSPKEHDAPGLGASLWPDDFTSEEGEFAAELRALFPVDREELPPLYIQTLLDDEAHTPLAPGYERRLTASVRRSLDLPRPPLYRRGLFALDWGEELRTVVESTRKLSRPLVAVVALTIFCMLGTALFATPSFAEGLRLLFGQAGAQQIGSYPQHVAQERLTGRVTGPLASAPAYWPGPMVANNYAYEGMRVLPQEQYSSSPIIDLQYVLTQRTSQQTGSGLIDIREFQIADNLSAVLQSVQAGSATVTTVNGLPAVYVDGMWVSSPGQRTTWQSGQRSMLIFERAGVIFWIVSDQRDGIGQDQLVELASQMMPVTTDNLVQANLLSVRLVGAELGSSMRTPIGYNTELLTLIPKTAAPESANGEFVASGQPSQGPSN